MYPSFVLLAVLVGTEEKSVLDCILNERAVPLAEDAHLDAYLLRFFLYAFVVYLVQDLIRARGLLMQIHHGVCLGGILATLLAPAGSGAILSAVGMFALEIGRWVTTPWSHCHHHHGHHHHHQAGEEQ